MSFSSPLFLVLFLPATLLVYWLVPRKAEAQNLVLLVASYLFFYSWGPKAFAVFLLATVVNYVLLLSLRRRDADGTPVRARLVLWLGLTYNLGQLLLLKYIGFFAETVEYLSVLLGGTVALPSLSLLLPIGISFWTLQLTAYLVDVAYGRRDGPQSFIAFAVFAGFFPQVLAGPIARADLLDQFEHARTPTAQEFSRGAFEFFLGYILCFLVGTSLATLVNPVYADPVAYDAGSHWLALYAYTNQIFCDFAGYSLMALGLGRCFGLKLIENFRFPFLARNISEFWKRWHVSLTNILFDYIYTPLVTGKGWLRGKLGAGLFVVLLVSGLWHGATWMFVLWGALHGLVLMGAHRWDEFYRGLCRNNRVWVQRRRSLIYIGLAWLLTQTWFMLSLIPFRAPDFSVAAAFAGGLLGADGTEALDFGNFSNTANLLLCLALVPVYHLSATAPGRAITNALYRVPAPLRGATYGAVVVYLFVMQPLAEGTFVYANF